MAKDVEIAGEIYKKGLFLPLRMIATIRHGLKSGDYNQIMVYIQQQKANFEEKVYFMVEILKERMGLSTALFI